MGSTLYSQRNPHLDRRSSRGPQPGHHLRRWPRGRISRERARPGRCAEMAIGDRSVARWSDTGPGNTHDSSQSQQAMIRSVISTVAAGNRCRLRGVRVPVHDHRTGPAGNPLRYARAGRLPRISPWRPTRPDGSHRASRAFVLLLAALMGARLAWFVQGASTSTKFRTEAFSVMLGGRAADRGVGGCLNVCSKPVATTNDDLREARRHSGPGWNRRSWCGSDHPVCCSPPRKSWRWARPTRPISV